MIAAPSPAAAVRRIARRRRAERGMTFIEALIAMAVLSFALVGLIQLTMLSILNTVRAGEISNATFLSQQTIDHLRGLTAAELTSFPSAARGESADENLDLNADGTIDFRRLTQVNGNGLTYEVKVFVFPGAAASEARANLLADPMKFRVRASTSTIIGR